jgi:hypothetical protein
MNVAMFLWPSSISFSQTTCLWAPSCFIIENHWNLCASYHWSMCNYDNNIGFVDVEVKLWHFCLSHQFH